MKLLEEKLNHAFELFDTEHLDEADALYNECLNQVSDINSNEYSQVLHGLGYVKASQQNMDHCIAIRQLGMVERMAKCFEEAVNLFQLEAKLLKDYKIESPLNWSTNYYEQGYVALLMNNIVLAEQLLHQSLQLAIQSEDNVCLGCAYRGLGEVYRAKGEEVLAKKSFHQAMEAFEKVNDKIAVQEIIQLLK